MKTHLIIWADEPSAALKDRDAYRAKGAHCVIRTSRGFTEQDVEPAHAITFMDAHNADEIAAAYRQAYRGVKVIDLGAAPPSAAVDEEEDASGSTAAPVDPQLVSDLEAMSDADLKTLVEGLTGRKAHHKAGRPALLRMYAEYKQGQAGPNAAAPVAPASTDAPAEDQTMVWRDAD